MDPGRGFLQALTDYRYLLERRYPQKTILQLIGTRHGLSRTERSMLYRGVFPSIESGSRIKRLIHPDLIRGESLHVDGYNILFTISSYLKGITLYLAEDGLLRDTLEGHGDGIKEETFKKAVSLTGEFIHLIMPSRVIAYLDRQIEKRYMAEKLILMWRDHIQGLEIIKDNSPDQLIREIKSGVIATSDSDLIDRSGIKVCDLARGVIEKFYNPRFLRLSELGK